MTAGDDWGQASVNNTNGFGKGAENNTISWGLIQGDSYGHPRTNLTGGGGFTGLLDEVPNAAFAASVRLLRSDYSGGLVRVIAYDGVTQQGAADVMPYNTGSGFWIDLNSTLENLDATAIGRGLTTSDTLADLCSFGVNDYDGLTTTWYGQNTGATINASQLSISSMPKIVNAGALVTENGKPVLAPQNSNVLMDFSSLAASNYQIHAVGNSAGLGGSFVSGGDDVNNRFDVGVRAPRDTRLLVSEGGSTQRIDTVTDYTNQQVLLSANQQQLRVNGGQVGTGTITNAITQSTLDFALFKRRFGLTLGGAERLQEVVFYAANENSNMAIIEANINNAFNIYP